MREFRGQNFYRHSINFFSFFVTMLASLRTKFCYRLFTFFSESFQKNVKRHVFLKSEKNEKYVFSNTVLYPKVSEQTASEKSENCRIRQPHCRLMPSPRGIPANIRIYLIFLETRIIGRDFAFIVFKLFWRERLFLQQCASAVHTNRDWKPWDSYSLQRRRLRCDLTAYKILHPYGPI